MDKKATMPMHSKLGNGHSRTYKVLSPGTAIRDHRTSTNAMFSAPPHHHAPIGNVTVMSVEANGASGNYGYTRNGSGNCAPSNNRRYGGASTPPLIVKGHVSSAIKSFNQQSLQNRIAGGASAVETGTVTATGNSKITHVQSHHIHQNSHHHNNNNTNNSNNNNTTKTITSHHTQHNNNNNNNNHNTTNKNNNKITTLFAPVKTTAGGSPTDIQMAGSNTKTVATARSKNEEAIHDLRTRIPEIENIFDVQSRIGNGTFSTVLLGTLKKERSLPEAMKRKFAIKHHIPTSHPDRIMKELQCMAKIGGSDNVVGINCCIRYNESVAFIMPYMQHDRFHDFFNKMDLSELQFYMKNLLIALRHVHKFNVIHRDVKPSNFLYNRRQREFLLVDFGLAQHVPATQTQVCTSAQLLALKAGVPVMPHEGLKRPREGAEIEMASKRAKLTNGNTSDNYSQQQHATTSNARGANSCMVATGTQSPFKMPLKQLNEINSKNANIVLDSGTTPGGCNITVAHNPNNSNGGGSIYDGALNGRQVRSMVNTIGGGNVRARGGQAAGMGPSGMVPTSSKYNTNRHGAGTNDSKCYCYGNPQVCNICLVKKEIHASRAGTPGYRPPEVLLKYPDQTTAVDIWAAGVIFLSILSSVYPFFKAPNDFVALAEMVTIFGDKTIRKTAFALDRLLTLSQKTKPLDLRKLCVRFRNRAKFSSPDLLRKYQDDGGHCEVCKNCDQFFFNCLCLDTEYKTEPLDDDDPFPDSAYDLLYRLLEVNPHERITAEEALEHPFFTDPWLMNKNAASTDVPMELEPAAPGSHC